MESYKIRQEDYVSSIKKEYSRMKKTIERLTSVDDLLSQIDYSGDKSIETQIKTVLALSYQIEAELKVMAYKG